MESMDIESSQLSVCFDTKRRIRKGPTKRWTQEDTMKVLNYLLETIKNSRGIEKPTAQTYYTKLISTTNIQDASVDIIKNKVRNLKTTYSKAVQWLNETGQGLLEENDGTTVKEYVHKICPYYDLLNEIFSTKSNVHITHMEDTLNEKESVIEGDETSETYPVQTDNEVEILRYTVINDNIEISEKDTEQISDVDEHVVTGNDVFTDFKRKLSKEPVAAKKKRHNMKTAVDSLATLQNDRFEIQSIKLKYEEKRLEFEKEAKLQEIELQKQQLELEKEKVLSNERMHILTLEKEERIARYEIECKYKIMN